MPLSISNAQQSRGSKKGVFYNYRKHIRLNKFSSEDLDDDTTRLLDKLAASFLKKTKSKMEKPKPACRSITKIKGSPLPQVSFIATALWKFYKNPSRSIILPTNFWDRDLDECMREALSISR